MRILGGVVPLMIGALALLYSYSLSLGTLGAPGPGLWPLLISVVILLGSVALIVSERDRGDYERFTSRARFIVFGIVSLGLFAFLFERIGFIIPSFFTFIFWLRFLGRESWRSTLIISAIATTVFYILFVSLLGVPFPEDIVLSNWDS